MKNNSNNQLLIHHSDTSIEVIYHSLVGGRRRLSNHSVSSLLFPGIGVDGGKAPLSACCLVDAGGLEVGVVDEHLPLTGGPKLAEPPPSSAWGTTRGAGPRQV
jgi:hypothetical protein